MTTGERNQFDSVASDVYFVTLRSEPLDAKENARVQVAELVKAAAEYEYDINHPHKYVVSYREDCFLDHGTALPLLACK